MGGTVRIRKLGGDSWNDEERSVKRDTMRLLWVPHEADVSEREVGKPVG